MGFLPSVIYIEKPDGSRADPVQSDGSRAPIILKLAAGMTATAEQTGGLVRVTVTNDLASSSGPGMLATITGGNLAYVSNPAGTAGLWASITNDHVAAGAAIAGTKVVPAFGNQNVSFVGSLTQSGGAFTIVGNAASQLATSSGELAVLSASTLTLDAAGPVNIAGTDIDQPVNVGTDGERDVTVGSVNGAASLLLRSGLGLFIIAAGADFDIDAAGPITIDSTGGPINLGANDVDQPVNIGADGERTVTVGSTNGAASLTLRGGSGGVAIDSGGGVNVATSASSSTVTLGRTGQLVTVAGELTHSRLLSKSTATARTNNTLAADPHLVATGLVAGAKYQLRLEAKVTQAGAAASFKCRWVAASGLTVTSINVHQKAFSSSLIWSAWVNALNTDHVITMAAAQEYRIEFSGEVVVNAAGNLEWHWAQNTTDANATTVSVANLELKRIA